MAAQSGMWRVVCYEIRWICNPKRSECGIIYAYYALGQEYGLAIGVSSARIEMKYGSWSQVYNPSTASRLKTTDRRMEGDSKEPD